MEETSDDRNPKSYSRRWWWWVNIGYRWLETCGDYWGNEICDSYDRDICYDNQATTIKTYNMRFLWCKMLARTQYLRKNMYSVCIHIISYAKCNELEHVDTHFLLSLSNMSPLPWTVQKLINHIPNYKPNQVNFVCEFNVWDNKTQTNTN